MKIHPITYIIAGLLGVSIGINYLQSIRIEELRQEKYPVIIRRNIEFYEKAREDRVI
jgi:hypothetical protein